MSKWTMSSFISVEELLADETPELRAWMKARGEAAVRAEALHQLRALAKKKQDGRSNSGLPSPLAGEGGT